MDTVIVDTVKVSVPRGGGRLSEIDRLAEWAFDRYGVELLEAAAEHRLLKSTRIYTVRGTLRQFHDAVIFMMGQAHLLGLFEEDEAEDDRAEEPAAARREKRPGFFRRLLGRAA